MELKFCTITLSDLFQRLLIVLNGIEMFTLIRFMNRSILLIVLNGIEIDKLNFIFMIFIIF